MRLRERGEGRGEVEASAPHHQKKMMAAVGADGRLDAPHQLGGNVDQMGEIFRNMPRESVVFFQVL